MISRIVIHRDRCIGTAALSAGRATMGEATMALGMMGYGDAGPRMGLGGITRRLRSAHRVGAAAVAGSASMTQERLAAMQKVKPALDALYRMLTSEQRQKADRAVRMH